MRIFMAVYPPPEFQAELSHLLKSTPGLEKIHWGSPESFHITLKFVGKVSKENMPKLQAVLTSTAQKHGEFDLSLSNGGGFPTLERPRILWAGVQGDLKPLISIASDLETSCAEMGFPQENRKFSPHVTLARVEGVDTQIRQIFLAALSAYQSPPFRVDHIHLIESQPKPTGSLYTTLFSAPLLSQSTSKLLKSLS